MSTWPKRNLTTPDCVKRPSKLVKLQLLNVSTRPKENTTPDSVKRPRKFVKLNSTLDTQKLEISPEWIPATKMVFLKPDSSSASGVISKRLLTSKLEKKTSSKDSKSDVIVAGGSQPPKYSGYLQSKRMPLKNLKMHKISAEPCRKLSSKRNRPSSGKTQEKGTKFQKKIKSQPKSKPVSSSTKRNPSLTTKNKKIKLAKLSETVKQSSPKIISPLSTRSRKRTKTVTDDSCKNFSPGNMKMNIAEHPEDTYTSSQSFDSSERVFNLEKRVFNLEKNKSNTGRPLAKKKFKRVSLERTPSTCASPEIRSNLRVTRSTAQGISKIPKSKKEGRMDSDKQSYRPSKLATLALGDSKDSTAFSESLLQKSDTEMKNLINKKNEDISLEEQLKVKLFSKKISESLLQKSSDREMKNLINKKKKEIPLEEQQKVKLFSKKSESLLQKSLDTEMKNVINKKKKEIPLEEQQKVKPFSKKSSECLLQKSSGREMKNLINEKKKEIPLEEQQKVRVVAEDGANKLVSSPVSVTSKSTSTEMTPQRMLPTLKEYSASAGLNVESLGTEKMTPKKGMISLLKRKAETPLKSADTSMYLSESAPVKRSSVFGGFLLSKTSNQGNSSERQPVLSRNFLSTKKESEMPLKDRFSGSTKVESVGDDSNALIMETPDIGSRSLISSGTSLMRRTPSSKVRISSVGKEKETLTLCSPARIHCGMQERAWPSRIQDQQQKVAASGWSNQLKSTSPGIIRLPEESSVSFMTSPGNKYRKVDETFAVRDGNLVTPKVIGRRSIHSMNLGKISQPMVSPPYKAFVVKEILKTQPVWLEDQIELDSNSDSFQYIETDDELEESDEEDITDDDSLPQNIIQRCFNEEKPEIIENHGTNLMDKISKCIIL